MSFFFSSRRRHTRCGRDWSSDVCSSDITDVNQYRLDLATRMGATRAVDVSKEKLTDVMNELGMKEGFDVGLEMSGVPSAFAQMLETMNHGGKIAMLGIPPQSVAIDWNQVKIGRASCRERV